MHSKDPIDMIPHNQLVGISGLQTVRFDDAVKQREADRPCDDGDCANADYEDDSHLLTGS